MKLGSTESIEYKDQFVIKKPSKRSKTKDHINALEKRLRHWEERKFGDLFWEAQTIQDSLKTIFNSCDIALILKQFADVMQKGNANGSLNLIMNNMVVVMGGHPEPASFTEGSILET